MHFEVKRYAETLADGTPTIQIWTWRLVKNDGPVCSSPDVFPTEAAARSHLAKAKTAMKGAGRCKVITLDSNPSDV
jgi:hypothetical protein